MSREHPTYDELLALVSRLTSTIEGLKENADKADAFFESVGYLISLLYLLKTNGDAAVTLNVDGDEDLHMLVAHQIWTVASMVGEDEPPMPICLEVSVQ